MMMMMMMTTMMMTGNGRGVRITFSIKTLELKFNNPIPFNLKS